MSTHRLTLDSPPPPPGSSLTIADDQAWHAVAVKRIETGETVHLLDGRGNIATATVTATSKSKREASLTLRIEALEQTPPTRPRIEVWSAVPKADRATHMIDQLAQAGAAAWRPLVTERSVAEAGEHKLDRLQRIATEASKQCGRAWHMTIDSPRTLDDIGAWLSANHTGTVLLADGSGKTPAQLHAADNLLVLVGPEGGFSKAEIDALTSRGVVPLRLGPHILRTETAAVAAAVALVSR